MNRLFTGAGIVSAVLFAVASCPGGAHAAVRIGSDLRSIPDRARCSVPSCATGRYAVIQTNVPAPARPNSPYQGVITKWSVRGAGPLRLFVARYGPDDVAMGLAMTSVRTGLGPTKVATFATRLPIARGDFVGLNLASPASNVGMRSGVASASFDSFADGVGSSWTHSTAADVNWELGYNAIVEPDRDGDGYGDETQDRCPGNRNTTGPCPPTATVPAPARDVTAPAFLDHPRMTPRRVRRGAAALRVTLSEAAAITVRVYRGIRRRGHRTRFIFVKRVAFAGAVGRNALPLLAHGRKRPGRYRITVRATDAAGNTSAAARTALRVVRHRRH
jgi:hypothetical protein